MRLELHKHRIERVDLGKTTKIQDHTLFIDKEELFNLLSEDPGAKVDVVI